MSIPSSDRATVAKTRSRGVFRLLLGVVLCAILIAPSSAFAAYRQTYGFVNRWTVAAGTPSAQFEAYGMALAPSGDVIIASHDTYVAEYTVAGVPVTTLGSTVTTAFGAEGFDTANNVAVRGTDMWVLDYDKGVAKLDTSGQSQGVYVASVPGVSSLEALEGVAVDASGCVYVTDHGSPNGNGFRVAKFTSNGTYVTSFGDVGTPLWSAHSVAVGPDWQVYVADGGAGAVRRYTPDATRTGYTLTGTWTNAAFGEPQAVATDAWGNVFVLDYGTQTVTKLDPSGNPLARWGGIGSGNGLFTTGWSLVVAPNGHVFVDDRSGAVVQEFQLLDLGPITWAAGNVTVKKGKNAGLKYKVDEDVSSSAKVTIKVYKGSKLKATVACGSVSQGTWHTKSWKCKLAKGTYKWKVYATDAAGHAQRNVAVKTLKVK